jgi:hypothetical protein
MRRLALPVVLVAASCSSGVTKISIGNRDTYWESGGFTQLVPAIHPPTSENGDDKVALWIKIPDGVKIAKGGKTIVVPDGTIADRVERVGFGATDVRGTRFAAGGVEFFHVYHSDERAPGAPLPGFEWKRGDGKQQEAATRDLLASLDGRPPPELEMLRQFNECATCHQHDREPITKAIDMGPRRVTDGSGLFALLANLNDSAPVEVNRQRDVNVDDKFIKMSCGTAQVQLQERPGGARRYLCTDGSVPIATLDTAAARAANDPHGLAVCASRSYLREHMTDDARALFQTGFAECGL